MKIDSTAFAIIVDRSGSMEAMVSDVKGGVRQLIADQKKDSSEAKLTLVQFDHEYQVVHNFVDLTRVDENEFANAYQPRGSTALLDAIGRTIIELSNKIDAMPENEKPEKKVVTVITDGFENSSKSFTVDKVKGLIKEYEAQGWVFVFMGASVDTIQVAQNMGFSAERSAYYSTKNFGRCMSFVNEKITSARSGQAVTISEEERRQLAESNSQANSVQATCR